MTVLRLSTAVIRMRVCIRLDFLGLSQELQTCEHGHLLIGQDHRKNVFSESPPVLAAHRE